MSEQGLTIAPIVSVGGITVSNTLVTSWCIIVLLWLFCWWLSRRLRVQAGPFQTVIEAIITVIDQAVAEVAPDHKKQIMPFIASLWIFLVIANLLGVIPGLHSPTRDLSATAALAFLVFLSTHWFGIRDQGLAAYLRHYLSPSPIMLPFHIISEITRSVALAVRLFGNMMSLEMAALLVLLVAGFLAPIPILMLHVVEALVQAYIFGMLALIYVAGGIQSQQLKQQGEDHD